MVCFGFFCPPGQAMMEQSKKSSLVVARSILNNKLISKKLERYLKVGICGAAWYGVKPVATLSRCRNFAVAAVEGAY